jgi:hypothetical protein
MPNNDTVDRSLQAMGELDFVGWNNADWTGVFARYHTDESTRGLARTAPDPRSRCSCVSEVTVERLC